MRKTQAVWVGVYVCVCWGWGTGKDGKWFNLSLGHWVPHFRDGCDLREVGGSADQSLSPML